MAKPGRGSAVLLVAFASLVSLGWVSLRQNLQRKRDGGFEPGHRT